MKLKFRLSFLAVGIMTVAGAVIAIPLINEISGRNRRGIDNLIKEVSRFKVE